MKKHLGLLSILTGHYETYEVTEDHMGVFSESNVRILANDLKKCLQKTAASKQGA